MKKITELKASLAELFDLPRDVILNRPNIYLLANSNLVVENHRGLIKYSLTEIVIRTHQGRVVIKGNQFAIKVIKKDVIAITGQIKELSFELS